MPSSDAYWTYYAGSDEDPKVLKAADLPSVAAYMKSKACKNVFIMAGAGISTSAGIPDFRSPDTGLYHNLARLNLPHPQAVFEIRFFRNNPVPFYMLAHELAPGRFRPTPTHSFIRLLAEKGLLHTCFTQNIDTLERRAGVPADKIIEAHGSFASQHCIDCGAAYPDDKIKQHIQNQQIPHCEKTKCNGLVKPDIVFFGEALPTVFHRSLRNLRDADLLIVMGTSLTVHPFAGLTDLVPEDCPRMLINLDLVGDFDRSDDVVCLGKCDDVVRELSKELGWEQELDKLWAETASSLEGTVIDLVGTEKEDNTDESQEKTDLREKVGAQGGDHTADAVANDKAASLKEEVEKLTEEIGKTLQVSPEETEPVDAGKRSSAESTGGDAASGGGKL